MKRLGIGVAALLLAAGCGSSDGPEKSGPTAEATPTLALLSTAQACTQVQMVNEKLHGPGSWAIPEYGEFGEETAPLADQSVPEISDALRSMSEQALKVGDMSGIGDDVTEAASEWATRYQAVADICARTDSPIGRLP